MQFRQGPTSQQTEESLCFQGGQPLLLPNEPFPHCGLCTASLTFFFQIGFSIDHPWCDSLLSVFACTQCQDQDHLIPAMLDGQLRDARIPEGFLASYQVNFKFVVSPRAGVVRREDYLPLVCFRNWEPTFRNNNRESICIEGAPHWLLEDESPSDYNGRAMVFLAQLPINFTFECEQTAPPQIKLGLDGSQMIGKPGEYALFIKNQLYLFGTKTPMPAGVYAITQVD